jgi:hypothetical protein
MTALRFWLVLLQLSGLAWASNAEYVLKAYGLKIARLQINHDEKKHSITVSANSLVTNKLFPQLNNHYLIKYRENYQPESLTRIIRQKHLSDTVVTEFDFEKGLAISTRKSDGSVSSYTIKSGTRDVFSFLAFVSNRKRHRQHHETMHGWKRAYLDSSASGKTHTKPSNVLPVKFQTRP